MARDQLPPPAAIIATHEEIEEAYDLTHRGARVAVPQLELRRLLEDVATHETVHQRAAALLRKLITAHLFEDGNKRTAWATTISYLDDLRETPAETGDRVPHILRCIRRYDVDELAVWLETGAIDEDRLDP